MMNTRTLDRTAVAAPSLPNMLLRLEGLAVFISAILLYAQQGYSGLAFIALLFVVDLSAVGYAVNTRVGSMVYNAAHTYVFPTALALLALTTGSALGLQLALIWCAHIGLDRALGFGLKYATAFKDTHFQRV